MSTTSSILWWQLPTLTRCYRLLTQLEKLKMIKSCQSSAYTISWLSKITKCLVYCVFGNICHSFDLMAATGRGSVCVCRTRYNNMANRVIYWMFYDTFCIRPNILQSAHLQFYFRGPSCKASRKRAGSNNKTTTTNIIGNNLCELCFKFQVLYICRVDICSTCTQTICTHISLCIKRFR